MTFEYQERAIAVVPFTNNEITIAEVNQACVVLQNSSQRQTGRKGGSVHVTEGLLIQERIDVAGVHRRPKRHVPTLRSGYKDFRLKHFQGRLTALLAANRKMDRIRASRVALDCSGLGRARYVTCIGWR